MTAKTSVIIACNNAEAVITPCLTRLQQQSDHLELEIIVADGSADRTPLLVEKQFPTVTLLHFEKPMTLPELRGRGIALASGDIIAILDPYSMVAPDWLEQLVLAHSEQDHPVIGGSVELYQARDQGLLVWAQFINEYGMFMPPIEKGEIGILPGSNISYKRAVLFEGDSPRFTEFWKTFVNASIERSGRPLWQTPSIGVALWKPLEFGDFFLTRFTHGRCYAGMRCMESSRLTRLLRMLSTPFVPFVLQYRWSRRVQKALHYGSRLSSAIFF